MDKASEEHKRQKGYVKDPRVPEQPGKEFPTIITTPIINTFIPKVTIYLVLMISLKYLERKW